MSLDTPTITEAERQCKANGTKLTNKRKQVLAGLLNANKALSAYELADYCKSEFKSSMPAMSVYRILEFLQKEQLVHELKLANKYVACTHINCGHKHEASQFLICTQCQKVEEINVNHSTIEDIKQNAQNAGFQLASQHLEVNGICNECSQSRS